MFQSADVELGEPLELRAAQVQDAAELAELLRALRRRHARGRRDSSLSLRELAARTGWSHTAIAQYFNGRTLPPTDRLDALVRLLGATPAEQGELATARDRLEERRRHERLTGGGTPAGTEEGHGAVNGLMEVMPRQLPAIPAQFVGRATELALLTSLVDRSLSSRTAVISLAGPAGVGKTALAIQWAHQTADRFNDGQLYVNLRGFDRVGPVLDPAHAIRGFLDALHVPPQQVPVSIEAQIALYRSLLAGRRMLVVLDNARDAEQVRPLLPGTSGCTVVVTSRSELTGLVTEGAYPVVLDLLSIVEARDLLACRIGPDRIAAEPQAVIKIVNLCACLPLALSVVAARVATRPTIALADIAEQLHQTRFDALDTGDAATDVRGVFSWSYNALTPDAAKLFRLLGLHPGPDVSGAAAASLAGLLPEQIRPLLAELSRAHLLMEHVAGRYTFHDLLRAYAAERAYIEDTDEQRRAAAQRLLDHYLHTAFVADRLLEPTKDSIRLAPPAAAATPEHLTEDRQATAWFTIELPILIGMIRHAAATGWDGHAWQLAWTLTTFLGRQGQWHDQAAVQQIAVTAADRMGDRIGQICSSRNLAIAHLESGRYREAQVHLQQALDIAERAGDRTEQARTHVTFGYLWAQQGRPADGLTHARQAHALYQAAGNRAGQARTLNQVGWCHALLGNYEQALAHCWQAFVQYQELGIRWGEAATSHSLGYAHYQLGNHEQATTHFLHALDLARTFGDLFFQADILTQLGDVYQTTGNHDAAETVWRKALDILDELDHPNAEALRAKLTKLKDELETVPG